MKIKFDSDFEQLCKFENMAKIECEAKIINLLIKIDAIRYDENCKELFGCQIGKLLNETPITADDKAEFFLQFKINSTKPLLRCILIGNGDCPECGGEGIMYNEWCGILEKQCDNCKILFK